MLQKTGAIECTILANFGHRRSRLAGSDPKIAMWTLLSASLAWKYIGFAVILMIGWYAIHS